MTGRREPWPERFWRHVDQSGACWLWQGARNTYGYGTFYKRHHRPSLAHRVSWELTNGPIAVGACVLHNCDVRLCVRPDHLRLGDKTENMRDRNTRQRQARGERMATAKLTAAQVIAIRHHYTGAYGNVTELAERYRVGRNAIYAVVKRETWKHI